MRRIMPTCLFLIAVLVPMPALSRANPEAFPPHPTRTGGPEPPIRGSLHSVIGEQLSPRWSYRLKITVNPDSIAGTDVYTDFPVLLALSGANTPGVFLHAKSDGSDLVVTKPDGATTLHREVVSYNNVDRTAEVWFRADTLSKQNNVFYLYYDNPDTSIVASDGSVWDQNYLAVYHFAEDPSRGTLRDYGLNRNDGVALYDWTSQDKVPAAIDSGWHFNGTSNWVSGDAIGSPDSSFTVSAWFALWNQNGSWGSFAFDDDSLHLSAMRNQIEHEADIATYKGFICWNPAPLPDTLLHNFVWAMDATQDTVRFFFDGKEQDIAVWYAPNPPYKVYTGSAISGHVGIAGPSQWNPEDLLTGLADEYRIYRGVRSPNWVLTDYRNERHGAGFIRFDPEEPTPVLVSGLEASTEQAGVVIRWEAMGGAFTEFFIDRRPAGEGDDDYVRLDPGAPIGARDALRYVDAAIEAGATYDYRIEGVTIEGDLLYFGPVQASIPKLSDPIMTVKGSNPGRGSVRLALQIPHGGRALVTVFDCSGRLVRTVLDENLTAGIHEVSWDGKDEMGRVEESGVYFARLDWSGRRSGRKLIIMR